MILKYSTDARNQNCINQYRNNHYKKNWKLSSWRNPSPDRGFDFCRNGSRHDANVPIKWSTLLEKLQIQPKYKIAQRILHKFKVVILKKSPSRSSAMLHGLISAAELNYDGASVSPPPTMRSNYRLFNLVKVQVLSKKYKDNFFSEALQMRNCTTRQLSYRSRFIKYCNKI